MSSGCEQAAASDMNTRALNYYEILNVQPSASYDEIKRAFHAAALIHHPDKQATASNADSSDSVCPNAQELSFSKLQEAWLTLKDAAARSLYDRHLAAGEAEKQVVVFQEFDLEDLDCNLVDDECEYRTACRCGDVYVLSEQDLDDAYDNIVLPCSSCSLNIRVRYTFLEEPEFDDP